MEQVVEGWGLEMEMEMADRDGAMVQWRDGVTECRNTNPAA
jgi:hypothetical protein